MKVTIRYGTRCYFKMRSKADVSQLNLPHGTKKLESGKRKSKKRVCSEVGITVNSPGNPWSQSWKRSRRLRCEEFAERKILRLE